MATDTDQVGIPKTFKVRFWKDLDPRLMVSREIQRRYDRLVEDAGADSYQKELLCQRAIFQSLQLETMESVAMRTGHLDTGVYTQAVNSLLGLLKALGLERKVHDAPSLNDYLKGKKA